MVKLVKRFISIICIVALFVGNSEILRYVMIDDTNSYTRITMHQMYSSEQNIDIAFVGSSHTYRSLVPEITDAGFDAYTFNCGSSSQQMDGSLAIIQELLADNDVDTIYLEMYYAIALDTTYQSRTEMTSTYIISDYMKPSARKFQYLLNASSKDYWINSFILARRNWEKLYDIDYMLNLISEKQTESYKNYEWVREEGQTEYYVDKGFVANEGIIGESNFLSIGTIDMDGISADWESSLQDIIAVCKENNVRLVLFVAPMPEWTVASKTNYDEYHNFVSEIAQKADICFYDFNYVKNKYFSTMENEYFKDNNHLNLYGAEEFSYLFVEFFTDNISEEELFYSSMEEKMREENPYVYGLIEFINDSNKITKSTQIISNKDSGLEYKIIIQPDDEEARIMQDFCENTEIIVPQDETGIIQISWRLKGETKEMGSLNFVY